MAEAMNSRADELGGVGRRGFLAMLGVGAAAIGSFGFLTARRGVTDRRKNAARILGVREDSLLMPRDEDIDRLLADR